MLTETVKQQIRLYLGFPSAWRFKHTRLESLLTDVTPEAEVQILTALDALATIEAKILAMAIRIAGLKRVDEIEFFANGANRLELQSLGRQYISRISIVLGVPVYSDVFGRTGYLGDTFEPGFGNTGASTPIRRG